MSRIYKLIEAESKLGAEHTIEALEVKINEVARDGYKLDVESIKITREDCDSSQSPIIRATAVMSKKEASKKKVPKKEEKPKKEILKKEKPKKEVSKKKKASK